MTTVEIIGAPESNFVWAVRIACAEKGVPHVNIPAPPHDSAWAVHPLGKIPTMRHGDVSLFESRAICLYIDRACEGPALAPLGAVAAAEMEQWVSLVVTDVEPLAIRRLLFGYMFPKTGDGSPDRDQIASAWSDLQPRLGALADRLNAQPWLAGQTFSLADCYLIPVLHYLSQTPEGKAYAADAPWLSRYLARSFERASVRDTAPVSTGNDPA